MLNTTTATTYFTINTTPDKKEIISRLFKEGHITLDEVMELMKESVVQVPTAPLPLIRDSNPLKTPWDNNPYQGRSNPLTVSYGNATTPHTQTVVKD